MDNPLFLTDIRVPTTADDSARKYAEAEKAIDEFLQSIFILNGSITSLQSLMDTCWRLPATQEYMRTQQYSLLMKEAAIHAAIAKTLKRLAFEYIPEVNRRKA